ncbi:MAG: hypothetical protein AMS25_02475 [Gemmatimonas sp. SM23_52]|nr:MAG: hypothetical protein AMS25_02475 [Gemmatimonas sp. SM23_52]
MLSYRQVATVVWTFLGFMVAAALVLNLRYKPVSGHDVYLDTWTGELHSLAAVERTPPAEASDLSAGARSRRAVEIAVLEGLVRQGGESASCGPVRFAFPAPGY